MPVSMIHTQHSSNYPHYGQSLAPPSDFSSPYNNSLPPQASKTSTTSLFPTSNPTGYISTSKDDTAHRFHLPSANHDAHHNSENYSTNNNNNTKNQYDTHVPVTLKHINSSDLDMPSLNANYHLSHAYPLYNLGSNNIPSTSNHPSHHSHNINLSSHSQAHEGHNTPSYPTMTSFTPSPSLVNPSSLPTHLQLATENVVSSHSSSHPSSTTSPQTSPSTNDINGMERVRTWANHVNHARGWTPQPPHSSPPSSPNKSPATPPSVGSQTSTAPPLPSTESTRNASPTHPVTRSSRSAPPPTLPKLRTSLSSPPSSSPPSSPSSPTSSTSGSPPSSPRSGSKRRRSDKERREKHNDTERKGRQKINGEIRVLKSLLPELQNSAAPKVSVLQCAVDTIKRRTEYANSMQQQNAHLRDENKSLKAEILRLQHMLGMAPPNQALPLHLHPVPSVPPVHSSVMHHQPLENIDKRHDGYSFPGPLAPSPSTSLPLIPSKQ